MGEDAEALLTMVGTHAGVAHSTEGDVLIGDVHDGVVDAGSARGGVAQDVPAVGLTAKVVEGQGLLAAGDVAHHLALLLEGEDGEDGAKDLVGEDGFSIGLGIGIAIGEADVGVEQRGLDEALGSVGAPSVEDIALGKVALDTLEGAVADHADVVLVVLDVGAVEGLDGLGKLTDKRLLDLLMDEEIVGGDAGLPRVERLAPGDALGGKGYVGRAVDDAGALASQLEDDGGEMLGGGLHHHLAQGGAAGEEDEVEALGKECLVDLTVTLHHGNVLGREGAGNHLLDDR